MKEKKYAKYIKKNPNICNKKFVTFSFRIIVSFLRGRAAFIVVDNFGSLRNVISYLLADSVSSQGQFAKVGDRFTGLSGRGNRSEINGRSYLRV